MKTWRLPMQMMGIQPFGVGPIASNWTDVAWFCQIKVAILDAYLLRTWVISHSIYIYYCTYIIHICVYKCICIYTCMYLCIYIYIHIYSCEISHTQPAASHPVGHRLVPRSCGGVGRGCFEGYYSYVYIYMYICILYYIILHYIYICLCAYIHIYIYIYTLGFIRRSLT